MAAVVLPACMSPEQELAATYDAVAEVLERRSPDCPGVASEITRIPNAGTELAISRLLTDVDRRYPDAPKELPIELTRSLARIGDAFEGAPCGREDVVLMALGNIITRPKGHWSRFDKTALNKLIMAE